MSPQERAIYYTTAGDNQTQVQSFYSNYWAESYGGRLPIFSQTIPTYKTVGGTLDYYGQNPLSVFTNLSKPFIRYTFTAETASIVSISKIIHRIYKIDYATFKNFQINQPLMISQNSLKQNQSFLIR